MWSIDKKLGRVSENIWIFWCTYSEYKVCQVHITQNTSLLRWKQLEIRTTKIIKWNLPVFSWKNINTQWIRICSVCQNGNFYSISRTLQYCQLLCLQVLRRNNMLTSISIIFIIITCSFICLYLINSFFLLFKVFWQLCVYTCVYFCHNDNCLLVSWYSWNIVREDVMILALVTIVWNQPVHGQGWHPW